MLAGSPVHSHGCLAISMPSTNLRHSSSLLRLAPAPLPSPTRQPLNLLASKEGRTWLLQAQGREPSSDASSVQSSKPSGLGASSSSSSSSPADARVRVGQATSRRLLTGMAALTSFVESVSLVACVLCCVQLMQMHGQWVALQHQQPAGYSAAPSAKKPEQAQTMPVSETGGGCRRRMCSIQLIWVIEEICLVCQQLRSLVMLLG